MIKSRFEAKNVSMRLAHSLGLSVIYRFIRMVVSDVCSNVIFLGSILPMYLDRDLNLALIENFNECL